MGFFNWGSQTTTNTPAIPSGELPEIFPFPLKCEDYVSVDMETMYVKILTDVLERTSGIPDEKQVLLWDNCLASESSYGLVTRLAKAMVDRQELFIVYDDGIKLIRKADPKETMKIKEDYTKSNKSETGVYISFKNYKKSDMIKVFSKLDYHSVSSLYKGMNLSKAIQVKIAKLRESVSLIDSEKAIAQAAAVASSLQKGNDVLLDATDLIQTTNTDITSTNSAMEFTARKLSFYLGLPASYITGMSAKGLGDTGEGDAKAVERGLKNYYFSIIKPVCDAIFGIQTSFKTEDFYGINTALEVVKTFELVSEEFISSENKLKIINKIFGLPEDAEGDEVVAPVPVVPPQVGNNEPTPA